MNQGLLEPSVLEHWEASGDPRNMEQGRLGGG